MQKLDHLDILQREYNLMKERNPRSSMNSFARYIQLTPSHYNDLLSGKCGLSAAKARTICQRLNISQIEAQIFQTSVSARHARSKTERERSALSLQSLLKEETTQLKLELFALVSEWQHFAILELVRLDSFQPDPKWIAEQLDVDVRKIKESIQRLVDLELLRTDGSRWTTHSGLLKTTDDIPSTAIKRYHAQMLRMAERSLYRDPVGEREFNSILVALDPGQIESIKKQIRKFQTRMSGEISRAATLKKKLYCLGLQLFPVTGSSQNR